MLAFLAKIGAAAGYFDIFYLAGTAEARIPFPFVNF